MPSRYRFVDTLLWPRLYELLKYSQSSVKSLRPELRHVMQIETNVGPPHSFLDSLAAHHSSEMQWRDCTLLGCSPDQEVSQTALRQLDVASLRAVPTLREKTPVTLEHSSV